MQHYDVWAADSGNLIACYDSHAAALALVRALLADDPTWDLILAGEDAHGKRLVTEGSALLALAAQRPVSAPGSSSSPSSRNRSSASAAARA